MYGVDIPGQKKYYKYVEKDWVQPPCITSSDYGGSLFVANRDRVDSPGVVVGSPAGTFNGSGGLDIWKDGGNLAPRLYCYVPVPIKLSQIVITSRYLTINAYASTYWGGESYYLGSHSFSGDPQTITYDVSIDDYYQFFTFRLYYWANTYGTAYNIKLIGKTKPQLVETTEEEAEFSIDYSGIKVRYADNKYYGL